MVNAIVICVFHSEMYLKLFNILLRTILKYSPGTSVIVYTNSLFMEKIRGEFVDDLEYVLFEINDTYDCIDKACKARLDIFSFSCVDRYEKFLYLDTDVVVKGNVDIIFEICEKDILYACSDGGIFCESSGQGYCLMNEEQQSRFYGVNGFSSGVLLFNNCVVIRDLFASIKADIIARPNGGICYDQPYIVYNAVVNDLYDNMLLAKYVAHRELDSTTPYIVYHFPEQTGECVMIRYSKMNTFLSHYNVYLKRKLLSVEEVDKIVAKIIRNWWRLVCIQFLGWDEVRQRHWKSVLHRF